MALESPKSSLLGCAVLVNGFGLWAIAASIVWTGHQPHTVLLGGDPQHRVSIEVSNNMSGSLTLNSDVGGFAIDTNNASLDVNLITPGKLNVDVNQ